MSIKDIETKIESIKTEIKDVWAVGTNLDNEIQAKFNELLDNTNPDITLEIQKDNYRWVNRGMAFTARVFIRNQELYWSSSELVRVDVTIPTQENGEFKTEFNYGSGGWNTPKGNPAAICLGIASESFRLLADFAHKMEEEEFRSTIVEMMEAPQQNQKQLEELCREIEKLKKEIENIREQEVVDSLSHIFSKESATEIEDRTFEAAGENEYYDEVQWFVRPMLDNDGKVYFANSSISAVKTSNFIWYSNGKRTARKNVCTEIENLINRGYLPLNKKANKKANEYELIHTRWERLIHHDSVEEILEIVG